MDQDFQKRRDNSRQKLDQIDKSNAGKDVSREAFFAEVYKNAEGDEAAVPWADMRAKDYLINWLEENPSTGRAIDIGCGLGDNAEQIAQAGFQTTAFDFSQEAVEWAKKRFPQSAVEYVTADLMDMPNSWLGAFDFVHESYTLQSIPPETLNETIPAIASLLASGGILLVYARSRADGASADGPPWPLEEKYVMQFQSHGLELISRQDIMLERPDRKIPHILCEWRKP